MRMVVVRASDDLRSREKLDRFLKRHVLSVIGRGTERSDRTYPSKSQGHHKHEMGGEYNQKVPHRILCDCLKNANPEYPRLRPCR